MPPPAMAAPGSTIPLHALVSFHTLERRLFARMVFLMHVNPSLAMEIIAFWMWLEEAGHPHVIRPILDLDDDAARLVAIEAKRCIASLPDPDDPVAVLNDVHDTFTANASPVSLGFVNRRRHWALHGVTTKLNNVCAKIFDDLVRVAVHNDKAHLSGSHGEGSSKLGASHEDGILSGLSQLLLTGTDAKLLENHGVVLNNSMNVASSIHPNKNNNNTRTMGYQELVPNHLADHLNYLTTGNCAVLDSGVPVVADDGGRRAPSLSLCRFLMGQQSSTLNPPANSRRPPQKEVPRDERTLFVTFSNGYPLKEDDLREFFAREFGPIEAIHIQQVVLGEEPLFARIVFGLQATMLLVLNGSEKVKFVIKGRHVWARRYVPKKKRTSSVQQQ